MGVPLPAQVLRCAVAPRLHALVSWATRAVIVSSAGPSRHEFTPAGWSSTNQRSCPRVPRFNSCRWIPVIGSMKLTVRPFTTPSGRRTPMLPPVTWSMRRRSSGSVDRVDPTSGQTHRDGTGTCPSCVTATLLRVLCGRDLDLEQRASFGGHTRSHAAETQDRGLGRPAQSRRARTARRGRPPPTSIAARPAIATGAVTTAQGMSLRHVSERVLHTQVPEQLTVL